MKLLTIIPKDSQQDPSKSNPKLHQKVRFIPEIQWRLNIQKSINIMNHIIRMKNKNHMVLKDAKKIFGKIQHLFVI